jgi:hypothetical protein
MRSLQIGLLIIPDMKLQLKDIIDGIANFCRWTNNVLDGIANLCRWVNNVLDGIANFCRWTNNVFGGIANFCRWTNNIFGGIANFCRWTNNIFDGIANIKQILNQGNDALTKMEQSLSSLKSVTSYHKRLLFNPRSHYTSNQYQSILNCKNYTLAITNSLILLCCIQTQEKWVLLRAR